MAYTVKYNGYDVSCDTVDDLRALLGTNGNGQPKVASVGTEVSPVHASKMIGVSALVSKLKLEQRNLLRHVSDRERVTRERLRQLVGVADVHQFAGILIGISKTFSGGGMKSPIEAIEERENGNGPRTYQYKIRNEVRAEVKEALTAVQ